MTAGRYAGRVAVITGAGSGLGAALCDLFAGEGAAVALLDIDGAAAEARAAELRARGTDALAMPVDVADRAALERAAAAVRERLGGCDLLCANVGVQQFGAIDALSEADWQWVMSVNFGGTVNTVAAFLPLIRAGGGARHIVITASAAVFQAGVRMAAYIASKHAVTGYGEVLRRELAPEGINVSLLFPAGMATRHLESSIAARPAALGPSRLDMADIGAMMADAGIDAQADTVPPAHAVRHLLDALEAGAPFIVTHGRYRAQVEARHAAVLAALARAASD